MADSNASGNGEKADFRPEGHRISPLAGRASTTVYRTVRQPPARTQEYFPASFLSWLNASENGFSITSEKRTRTGRPMRAGPSVNINN